MNRIFKQLMPLVFVMLSVATAIGQTGGVRGVVTDKATGESLPGANVLIKGTLTGASADFDGAYLIQNLEPGTVELEASFVGFLPLTKTITIVSGQVATVNFSLDTDAIILEETVVIGYGVQKKSDRTGAVASITAEEMNTGVLTDPIQGIQGKIAGVSVTKRGGDPNAGFDIRIRGASSLASGTGPLFVVDGVPGVDPTTIAPEDIESWNVLKDASSAAIYGSRGSNGVIIITTKRGEAREGSRIEFSSYLSTETVANRLDLISADRYRSFMDENPGLATAFIDGGASTDWQDEIYRTGMSQNYSLAVSGGNNKTTYRASVAHQDFSGVVIGSQKKRTTGRVNLDQSALNDRLKVSTGLSATIENNNYISYSGWGSNEILYQAFQRNPTDPVKSEDSDYFGGYYESNRVFQYYNPVALVDQIHNERDAKRYFGYLKADYEIMDGLEAGVNLAYTRNDDEGFYFEPTTMYLGDHEGYGRRSYNNYESKIFEATLRYSNQFGRHNIQSVAGYGFQEDFLTGFAAQGKAPFVNYTGAHDLSILQNVNAGDIWSYKSSSRLISFFGRGIYNYNSKYFLTATIRRDGSSKFGANNEWGWFPTASIMWNITGEDFMSNIRVLNNLRLRVGYGITGNQEIGEYNDLAYYRSAGNSFNFETGEEAILFEFAHNANPDLKWEENSELNVGIDFGFLEDRISGSFDYFNKRTYDLLGQYFVPVPPNPVSRIWANVGEFEVKGFELFVQAYPVRRSNFDWKTALVFSTYDQQVVSLSDEKYNWSRLREGWLSGPGLVGDQNWTQTVEEGIPIGTWYMPEYAGLSQDGMFLFHTAAGGVTRDLENAERRVVGSAQPDFELGWSNYFTFYKNFDMSFTIRGVYGYEVFNTTNLILGNPTFLPDRNVLEFALEEYERGLRDNPKVSSYYLEDASFIRLDNVSIGYNLHNVGSFDKIRFYLSSNNLYTLTNYSGIDPEINFSGLSFGLDQYNVYPKTRTIILGVNLSL